MCCVQQSSIIPYGGEVQTVDCPVIGVTLVRDKELGVICGGESIIISFNLVSETSTVMLQMPNVYV